MLPKDFNFLIYKSENEDLSVNAYIKDETIWLTQKSMAELFGCSTDNISLHLKNIYSSGELEAAATTEEISVVRNEGSRQVTRATRFYNLDAIISVGYRVNSSRATHFRMWATKILKEYMTKGFVLDDDRLRQGEAAFGKDYFRELLERVRSIRASERRIWFFDYIEDLIENETAFTMEDFAKSVNEFLNFRRFKILEGKGHISKKGADKKAVAEYAEFNKTQKINSDFDREVKKMLERGNE